MTFYIYYLHFCKCPQYIFSANSTSIIIISVKRNITTCLHFSQLFFLMPGTPSGVGPVKAGQLITAGITGLVDMSFPVVSRHKVKV